MSFLLDTHAFLWFVNDHISLSPTETSIIENQQTIVYLSAASIWEMAIKSSLRKACRACVSSAIRRISYGQE